MDSMFCSLCYIIAISEFTDRQLCIIRGKKIEKPRHLFTGHDTVVAWKLGTKILNSDSITKNLFHKDPVELVRFLEK